MSKTIVETYKCDICNKVVKNEFSFATFKCFSFKKDGRRLVMSLKLQVLEEEGEGETRCDYIRDICEECADKYLTEYVK